MDAGCLKPSRGGPGIAGANTAGHRAERSRAIAGRGITWQAHSAVQAAARALAAVSLTAAARRPVRRRYASSSLK